jgi:hypothetical protein
MIFGSSAFFHSVRRNCRQPKLQSRGRQGEDQHEQSPGEGIDLALFTQWELSMLRTLFALAAVVAAASTASATALSDTAAPATATLPHLRRNGQATQ